MKLLVPAAILLMAAASDAPPAERSAAPSAPMSEFPDAGEIAAMPNAATQRAGCRSLRQQVQDEADRDRSDEYRTLDREPAGQLLFAVDRQIDGCREATFVRRNTGTFGPELAPR